MHACMQGVAGRCACTHASHDGTFSQKLRPDSACTQHVFQIQSSSTASASWCPPPPEVVCQGPQHRTLACCAGWRSVRSDPDPDLDPSPRVPQVSVEGWLHTGMVCLEEGLTTAFDEAILEAEAAAAAAAPAADGVHGGGNGDGSGTGGTPAVWFHIPPFRMERTATTAAAFVSTVVHSLLYHMQV